MSQLKQYSWDVPTVQTLPQVNTGWNPKYPWGIPSDRQFNQQITPISDPGWVVAPITSHISRFKFEDARQNSLVRKFGRIIGEAELFGATPSTGTNPFARGASQLSVIFKGPEGQGEVAEYQYYFPNHEEGASVYDSMVAAIHPYGTVLYPRVIEGGIPYQRISSPR